MPPSIHDLRPDPENANTGTERGRALLEESVDTVGYGRGVFADRNLTVVAGNKTVDVAKARGAKVRLVPTDGTKLVIVQRTDLDLRTNEKARLAAYYDNQSTKLGLQWDTERIALDRDAGVDLTVAFFPEELATLAPVEVPASLQGAAPTVIEDPDDFQSPTERSIQAKHNAKKRHERASNEHRVTVHLPLETPSARANWTTFLKALKVRYPAIERPGDRLMQYLSETEGL